MSQPFATGLPSALFSASHYFQRLRRLLLLLAYASCYFSSLTSVVPTNVTISKCACAAHCQCWFQYRVFFFVCFNIQPCICLWVSVGWKESSAAFFKIVVFFLGYFDSDQIFLDNENKNFRGDLTDISAAKEALKESGVIGFWQLLICWIHCWRSHVILLSLSPLLRLGYYRHFRVTTHAFSSQLDTEVAHTQCHDQAAQQYSAWEEHIKRIKTTTFG